VAGTSKTNTTSTNEQAMNERNYIPETYLIYSPKAISKQMQQTC